MVPEPFIVLSPSFSRNYFLDFVPYLQASCSNDRRSAQSRFIWYFKIKIAANLSLFSFFPLLDSLRPQRTVIRPPCLTSINIICSALTFASLCLWQIKIRTGLISFGPVTGARLHYIKRSILNAPARSAARLNMGRRFIHRSSIGLQRASNALRCINRRRLQKKKNTKKG